MKSYTVTLLFMLVLAAGIGSIGVMAQSGGDTADAHVAAAMAAAAQEHTALFNNICRAPAPDTPTEAG